MTFLPKGGRRLPIERDYKLYIPVNSLEKSDALSVERIGIVMVITTEILFIQSQNPHSIRSIKKNINIKNPKTHFMNASNSTCYFD